MNHSDEKNIVIHRFSFYLYIITIAVIFPHQAFCHTAPRFLILNSYHKEFKWTDAQVEAAKNVITDRFPDAEIFVEYMDTKRNYCEEYLNALAHLYRLKYKDVKFDTIITTDDNALWFALDHREKLFKGSPISFCGINDFKESLIDSSAQVTGIIEVLDIKATIDLALEIHPKTDRIVVVADSTPTGIGQLKEIKKIAPNVHNVVFEYLEGKNLSHEALFDCLKALPENSVVLLTVWLRDKNDSFLPSEEIGRLISKNSNAPVYGIIDMFLGDGIVGGKLLNSSTHGRIAAEKALQLIQQKRNTQSIQVTKSSTNPFMFDYEQLDRWHIDVSKLPQNSIIINEPFSFYKKYKSLVISILLIFLFLTAMIAFLILNMLNRRKAESALKRSEEKYKLLADNANDVIWVRDMDLKMTYVSPSVKKVRGYDVEEAMNQDLSEVLTPKSAEMAVSLYSKMVQSVKDSNKMDNSITIELDHICKDGHTICMESNISLIRGNDGRPTGLLGVTRNISDRKRANEARRVSEEKFAKAFRSAPILMTITNVEDGRIYDVNDTFVESTGYGRDMAIGFTSTEIGFVSEEDRNRMIDTFHTQGRVQGLEVALHRADGTSMSCLYSAEPIEINGKKRLLSTAVDITERKNAEEKLRRLVEMLDTAPNSITVHDYEGKFLYANRKTFEIHGYAENEFMSLNVRDIDVPESQTLIEERMREVTGKGEISFQVSHFRKDGTTVPLEVFLKVVNWDGRPAMLSIATDITDRIQSETERNRLIHAIEQAGEIIVITTRDGSIQYVNPAFENVTGYSKDEVLGLNPRILKSGQQDEKFYAELWNTISSGKTWTGRLVNKSKNGSLYTEEATISPVRDKKGSMVSYVAVKRDITQELAIEQQLQQAQKMESIGNLSGGIAHDFNNILFPIIGLSEILLEDLPLGSSERENAEEIFKAGKRGRDLVKQILAFSRQSEHKMMPTRVQNVLKEVIKLSRSSIPAYIEIKQDIQHDCGIVMADPSQIHQIGMNIITNAYHAVEDTGGTITIALRQTVLEPSETHEANLRPGDYAVLSISDTGHGMSEELIGKIFNPYFTTKKQGKGTGLGLAVVYGIVKEHKGDIKIYSEIGKGSRFEIFLPLMKKSIGTDFPPEAEAFRGGSERILLVDDEEPVAKLEKQMLERLGYRVTKRINSIEALEAFKAGPSSFDLVVTDMSMPNIPGDELASKIKTIRSDIPVIICTGFSERINDEKVEILGVEGILMKPIVKSDLAELVRNVLDEAKS